MLSKVGSDFTEKASFIKAKNSPSTLPRCITPKLFMELSSHCGMVEPINLRSVYSLLLIFPAGLGCDKEKR